MERIAIDRVFPGFGFTGIDPTQNRKKSTYEIGKEDYVVSHSSSADNDPMVSGSGIHFTKIQIMATCSKDL